MRFSATWCLCPNFGDQLNRAIIEAIHGAPPVWVPPGSDFEHFLCVGSILNWASPKSVVWGAGLASWKDEVNPKADIRAVRGPLSRMRALSCGAKCPPVYGDPGLLAPRIFGRILENQKHEIGIVPHYMDVPRVNAAYREGGALIIDPLSPVRDVVEQIQSCSAIVSSSLHGLVIADAYGIPNLWAKFSDSVVGDGMKYWDYLSSVGRAKLDEPPMFTDQRLTAQLLEASQWKKAGEFQLGRVNTDALMAYCPFDPNGDPDKARRDYPV